MASVITAVGMVTSVGWDAATACAAIRAGISRAGPLADARVLDPETQTLVPATGHSVFGLTEGKSAVARWLSLASHAFLDLSERGELPGTADADFWRRTALAVVTPSLDDDRFMFNRLLEPEAIRQSYVSPLVRSLGVPIDPSQVRLLPQGRTGAIHALRATEQLFATTNTERLLVLAADSYLDGFSLQWLSESDRLKQDGEPTGLMPGEAGAAVLAERQDSAQLRGAQPLALVGPAIVGSEQKGYLLGERLHGRAIREVLTEVLKSAELLPFAGDMVVDLNGEAWRAYELGAALATVPRTLLDDPRQVLPALSIGDVGAATAVVGLIVAIRALERGYARSASALITSVSANGRVGAAILAQARGL